MICFPNAKINIGLHVTGKRPDGFHNIESIFYPISLKDALEVVINDTTSFTQTGLQLESAPKDNLVMKAYALMNRKYPLPALAIFLKKAIPSGAGLGGGSSDAAFFLKLLLSLPSLHGGTTKQSKNDDYMRLLTVSECDLLEMVESLGADCPFFLHNTPAIVTGTGNIFQKSGISLKGYRIYIVKPPVSISTKEAYAMVRPKKPAFSLAKLSSVPVYEWKYVLTNDFEQGIFNKFPVIESIKDKLYALGAEYASMSGSGSAVYGLFKNDTILPVFDGCFTWKGILE